MISKKNEIPFLYNKKEDCCGCGACYAICEKNAIEMKEDNEGFIYPIIDKNNCSKCNKCVEICPNKNKLGE